MGTDATYIIEKGEIFAPTCVHWEPYVIERMGRDYDLFDDMSSLGNKGFPNTCDEDTIKMIQDRECWGFGWMDYDDFLKLCEKHGCRKRYDVLKKRVTRCDDYVFRIVYGFDN